MNKSLAYTYGLVVIQVCKTFNALYIKESVASDNEVQKIRFYMWSCLLTRDYVPESLQSLKKILPIRK